jgi:hypothetical protein
MIGQCSGSTVTLSSSNGDLQGQLPNSPNGTFTGTIDYGVSVAFSVTK